MILVDGAAGEGGGQVVRTALSLSLVTGAACHIVNIRANRPRPGLGRQHLTALLAAQHISGAHVDGAEIGSRVITFEPRQTAPGEYRFDVGSAGSVTLIAETLMPALMLAHAPSRVTLLGGTHNPASPSFDFFTNAFLPVIRRLGFDVRATLVGPGFYPAGGGHMELQIGPTANRLPLALDQRGELRRHHAEAVVARLPKHIARRELDVIRDVLGWSENDLHMVEETRSRGPGNVVTATLAFDQVMAVFTGFGLRGKPAETVAGEVTAEVIRYLESSAAVGPHLADQLLVPMAVARGGRYTTVAPSRHLLTCARVIEQFVACAIHTTELANDLYEVVVSPA